MGKYSVLMSCGHEQEVTLFGKMKDRRRKIEYFEESGLCTECYKKVQEEKAKADGLIFNASILPSIDQEDGSVQLDVWFSGDTMPHKDEIKALGGYHWEVRQAGEDMFSEKRPPYCWQKIISIQDIEEEVAKAKSIGAVRIEMETDFWTTINYQVALQAQKKWKEKQDKIAALEKPAIPAVIKGHTWNKTVYGRPEDYSVYLDGEKTAVTDAQAQELRQYVQDKAEYLEKVRKIKNGETNL